MRSSKKLANLLLSAVIGSCLSMTTAPAFATKKVKDISVKNSSVAQLAVDWYHWQEAAYPGFGFGDGIVDCSLGQRGNIWFLGGSGGTTSERECMESIPAGKQLFFPLLNIVIWDEPLSTAERRQAMDEIFSDQFPGILGVDVEACHLTATLDGEPVVFSGTPIERVQSPVFTYLDDPEAVADGFWVLLPRLQSGEHTLNFTGSYCNLGTNTSIGFDVNVTYYFTIR